MTMTRTHTIGYLRWINGYEFIRNPDREAENAETIAHHRLIAFARGLIDDPFTDEIEIDHINRERLDNRESNLQPIDPRTHGRITREREVLSDD